MSARLPVSPPPAARGYARAVYGVVAAASLVAAGLAGRATAAPTPSAADPTLTATLTSLHHKTNFGWYRSPVTVHFTCVTNGAPLVGDCPNDVTLTRNAAGQSVTRSILATDGLGATAVVKGINIDQTKPRVTVRGVRDHAVYVGKAPRVHCAANEEISGVQVCVSSVSGSSYGKSHYKVVATSRAGRSSTVHGSYVVQKSGH